MLKRFWKKVTSLNLRELFSRGGEELVERLEERLIMADFGMDTAARIMKRIASESRGSEEKIPGMLLSEVESVLTRQEIDSRLHNPLSISGPSVIMLVGANGTGKTTTCARLAKKFMGDGCTVLLVAADTFRAGAAEQLTKWSERLDCEVIAQKKGADPAAVLYDGISAARSRGIDVVLCDTAGRLHTEKMLMEELRKIHRVSKKLIPSAPHEVLLVIDATTGQNAVRQAKVFHDAIGLTGLVLCKMDGTSKGGIVVSIVDKLGIPVKLLGVGEQPEDLLPFEPGAFAARLLGLSGNETSESTTSGTRISST